MECCNKDCEHIFFDGEKDYVCCPVCGELQQDRLPQDSFMRSQIIAKHFKIKKLVKLENNMYKFAIIWLFIEFFLEICLRYPEHKRTGGLAGTPNMLNFSLTIILVILFLAFGYLDEKVMFLKKKIGERAYFVTKLLFKIIKWALLALTMFVILKYVFPYFYVDYKPQYLAERRNLKNLELKLNMIEIRFILYSIIIIVIDVIELIKKKMCKNMVK